MNVVDLIEKKRDGGTLSSEELDFVIRGYVAGEIPDYQIAALLMAIYFQGMEDGERLELTRLMRDSGEVLDLSEIPGVKVDKHSTGGVGDKISLILAPLVAAAGVPVPMMSGRSLAHTGGTLDKLESIPGFNTRLTIPEFKRQVAKIGVAMIGQTEQICPADRKLYALRDATATVMSLPLICGSILSKKLAEGIDALVLDVKVGRGAIFREADKARELARVLVDTATAFGLPTVALLTQMEQPLGRAVGNWLETREAIQTLRGDGPEDVRQLSLALGAEMLLLGKVAATRAEAVERLQRTLDSGAAFERFVTLVGHQGGDVGLVERPERYPVAEHQEVVVAESSGWLIEIDARLVGRLAMHAGAGRERIEDPVDYAAGVVLAKKVGEAVTVGAPLAEVFGNDAAKVRRAARELKKAFVIGEAEPQRLELILGLRDASGERPWQVS
jgi:pyrimidine-nucleoside phosphorylase